MVNPGYMRMHCAGPKARSHMRVPHISSSFTAGATGQAGQGGASCDVPPLRPAASAVLSSLEPESAPSARVRRGGGLQVVQWPA